MKPRYRNFKALPQHRSELPLYIGILLMAIGLWFLFDSVRVTSGQYGWITGGFRNMWSLTTSTGIIFIPFIIGVVAIAYNTKAIWPRFLTGAGILMLIVEMFSRIRFLFNIKTSSLLLMLGLFAIGIGLTLRGWFVRRDNQSRGL